MALRLLHYILYNNVDDVLRVIMDATNGKVQKSTDLNDQEKTFVDSIIHNTDLPDLDTHDTFIILSYDLTLHQVQRIRNGYHIGLGSQDISNISKSSLLHHKNVWLCWYLHKSKVDASIINGLLTGSLEKQLNIQNLLEGLTEQHPEIRFRNSADNSQHITVTELDNRLSHMISTTNISSYQYYRTFASILLHKDKTLTYNYTPMLPSDTMLCILITILFLMKCSVTIPHLLHHYSCNVVELDKKTFLLTDKDKYLFSEEMSQCNFTKFRLSCNKYCVMWLSPSTWCIMEEQASQPVVSSAKMEKLLTIAPVIFVKDFLQKLMDNFDWISTYNEAITKETIMDEWDTEFIVSLRLLWLKMRDITNIVPRHVEMENVQECMIRDGSSNIALWAPDDQSNKSPLVYVTEEEANSFHVYGIPNLSELLTKGILRTIHELLYI